MLLRILQSFITAQTPAAAQAIAWPDVIARARAGRVLGIVGEVGLKCDVTLQTRQLLQMSIMRAAAEQRAWLQRFARVRAVLGDIELIALKGLALTQTIYRDAPLRVMSDIDLLVRAEALAPAVALLTRAGFAPTPPNIHRFHDAIAVRHAGGLTGRVSLASPTFSIDLHVAPRYAVGGRYVAFDIDALWARARDAQALGAKLLAPHDELAFLTAHALDRADPACAQLVDIALCLRALGRAAEVAPRLAAAFVTPPPAALAQFLRDVERALIDGAAPAESLAPFFAARPRRFAAPLQLYARTRVMAPKDRLLYLVGYLLPNENAYAGPPWSQFLAHTRDLGVRLAARATHKE